MEIKEPFDPLNKYNLGHSVADALLTKPVASLGTIEPFQGAGVYALYYTGDFRLYQPIRAANEEQKFAWPIYVGKAVPKGARKGGLGLDAQPGNVLFDRLAEHAKSLRQAENLHIQDFWARYLTVEDIWIPLGENLLIEMFRPLWNMIIDGFGNHDPGSGRHKQQISPWDILHPGRPWATRLAPGKPLAKIESDIVAYFAKHDAGKG